jgi:hypothetical protein
MKGQRTFDLTVNPNRNVDPPFAAVVTDRVRCGIRERSRGVLLTGSPRWFGAPLPSKLHASDARNEEFLYL